MHIYYVNNAPQSNGDHEVHHEECFWLLKVKDKRFLGLYTNCKSAINVAKKFYPTANGCMICSGECQKKKFSEEIQ